MALIALVVPLVIGGVFLSRAYAEVDEEFVHTWGDAHGLTLTTANRPLVWWYLRNARVLRTWGVLAGFVLPPLASFAFGWSDQGVSTTWWCLFAGHLAGALFAEVALRRPSPSGTRIATLDRREVAQYLPARLRFAPVVITAVATIVAGAGLATGDLTPSTRSTVVVTVVAALVVTALIAWCQRWIVTRPQPFTDAELVEADDSIRSQSVHMLAGSGSAVLLAIFGALFSAIAIDTDPPVSTVTAVLGLATVPMALVACLYYGHRAWRVRRTSLLGSVSAT